MIVGAYALAANGRPRVSQDIDVFVNPTLENAERLAFLGIRELVATKSGTGRTKDKLDIELLREAGLLED